jgi:predicted DNA-binding protein
MPERFVRYHLRLSKSDAARLDAAVKKSGLSRAAYIRALINNLIPIDKPPPDYHLMMRELHSIGSNLNQIAARAHSIGDIDAARYERNAAELRRVATRITEAVYEHRRLK